MTIIEKNVCAVCEQQPKSTGPHKWCTSCEQNYVKYIGIAQQDVTLLRHEVASKARELMINANPPVPIPKNKIYLTINTSVVDTNIDWKEFIASRGTAFSEAIAKAYCHICEGILPAKGCITLKDLSTALWDVAPNYGMYTIDLGAFINTMYGMSRSQIKCNKNNYIIIVYSTLKKGLALDVPCIKVTDYTSVPKTTIYFLLQRANRLKRIKKAERTGVRPTAEELDCQDEDEETLDPTPKVEAEDTATSENCNTQKPEKTIESSEPSSAKVELLYTMLESLTEEEAILAIKHIDNPKLRIMASIAVLNR